MSRTTALICFAVFLAVATIGGRTIDADPVIATIYGVCLATTTVAGLALIIRASTRKSRERSRH